MKTQTSTRRLPRRLALLGAVGASLAGAGCDNFMEVKNPGAVEPPALESPDYRTIMVQGVVGDFQPAYAWTSLFSGVFADELRNHHGYFENGEIDRRDVNNNNGTYILAVYNGLHRTRFLADSMATRMKGMTGGSAVGVELGIARVLAYGGYAWTLLGEQYCETPINRSAPVPSDKLLETALQRFEEAIQVAAQTKASPPASLTGSSRNAYIAGADSVLNFARVGAARAALDLSAYNPAMKAKAIEHARAVTPAYTSPASEGFEFHAHYMRGNSFSETRRIGNPFWEFVTAGRWFSLSGTPFLNLDDPRVPQSKDPIVTADATRHHIPLSPTAFSTYDPAVPRPFDATSSIRVASALEARYVIAEAEGLNAANLAFVNERRALGGEAPLGSATTSAEYMAALREQRARDFYLDGHRMGDLRRYKKAYGVDLWPKGSYHGSATLRYGDQECWPVPLSEQF